MKPTPIQIKARKEDSLMKMKIYRNYELLKAGPTDNISKIENNYVQLKKIYSDRHCVIPDVFLVI